MNDRVLVAKMIAYIEQNLVAPITVDTLVTRSGYSLNRLRQKFFNVTGDTPSGYLRKRRLTEASKEILAGARVLDVALKYGYSSQDNFTTAFRSFFGLTPTEISRIEGKYKRFIRTMREAYSIMELANLKQPPLAATLMGCIKGASDYFDNDLSTAMLFGLTGHAFLININKDMCPSAPYVWKKERFFELLEGIGIAKTAEYGVNKGTPETERRAVEEKLKAHMNEGSLCMLDFLEHQLASGYDEKGFTMLLPWNGQPPSEIPAITFGSWDQCLSKEGWAMFTILSKTKKQKPIAEAARDALEYALDMYRRPEAFEVPSYSIGHNAYKTWIDCVERGLGGSHGHWWNAMVWRECRQFAADFMAQLGEVVEGNEALFNAAAETYRSVTGLLEKATPKEKPAEEKVQLLREAAALERKAEEQIAGLLESAF